MPRFSVSLRLVVLTVRHHVFSVLSATTSPESSPGLPRGSLGDSEELGVAAVRVLETAGGLSTADGHVEQLGTYRARARPEITVAYLVLLPNAPTPRVSGIGWRAVSPALAEGEGTILADGVERARSKLEYSSLGARFCPPEFTINQLRKVYEAVWGTRLDPRNFHRKVTGTRGFVIATDRQWDGERGRPARLYRKGPADSLHPPLLRR